MANQDIQNLKILVLEGGFNEEHHISLTTGGEVKKSLKKLGIKFISLMVDPKTFKKDISFFDNSYICFNALHGTFGEDGRIQKILDEFEFNYTHSKSKASHIGFNKNLTKKKLTKNLITYPKSLSLNFSDLNKDKLNEILVNLGNFIIKPNNSGSSFGIVIFKNQNDIDFFLKNFEENKETYKNHNQLIVEEYLKGRELTVTVFEKDSQSVPIEVTEIISYNNNYFDYNSKYTPGVSKHILPADITTNLYNKCKKIAKFAHDKIDCRGLSRSDFILVNETIFFLEINTQPGLTPVSLVPEQLRYQNISFDDLILSMILCSK